MESLSETSWRFNEVTTISQGTDPIHLLVLTGDIAAFLYEVKDFQMLSTPTVLAGKIVFTAEIYYATDPMRAHRLGKKLPWTTRELNAPQFFLFIYSFTVKKGI